MAQEAGFVGTVLFSIYMMEVIFHKPHLTTFLWIHSEEEKLEAGRSRHCKINCTPIHCVSKTKENEYDIIRSKRKQTTGFKHFRSFIVYDGLHNDKNHCMLKNIVRFKKKY